MGGELDRNARRFQVPWYKGNIHCHSTNSDGDLSPREVAALYRSGGYDFICITDHNRVTDPSEADLEDDNFLVIPGIEFTYDSVESSYIHVNAIGYAIDDKLPDSPRTLVEGMRQIVEVINKSGAFSVLDHPNWRWGYGVEEIACVPNAHAFEVYNGASACNNHGDSEHASTDRLWDSLLSRGVRLLGIASDDAHDYSVVNPTYAEPPFTGWICVRAENLKKQAIMESLLRGDFYASNHPVITSMSSSRECVEIQIQEIDQIKYTTTFVGKHGRILKRVSGEKALYLPNGNEGYVRAVVSDTDGHKAWTQPVFLDRQDVRSDASATD